MSNGKATHSGLPGGKIFRINDRLAGVRKWQARRETLEKPGGPPATSSWRGGVVDSAAPD
jgi:hypothetical protein